MKKNGKYCNKKSLNMKPLALLLALTLLLGCAIGGTIAWLTSKTGPVVNTFTTSDLEVQLAETQRTYKMVPGVSLPKDPQVTVVDGSEDCYVFVKIEEENNTISGLAAVNGVDNSAGKVLLYTVDSAWQAVEGVPGVYWQKVTGLTAEANTTNWTDYVLTDNTVLVNQNVTKEMMDGTLTTNQPKLTFTAYASQLMNGTTEFTPEQAWTNVSGT